MIEEVIRLNTETKGGESVKSLRQEIREAKEEALKAARSFGEFSPQATAAAKKVAKLKDEMEDFNQKVAALNPDKFAKIATLTQSVAGGIATAQGAMVLFGDQSEEAAKSLAKVQSAIAFSQGVQQILDMRKQLSSLATDLLGKVKTAFTTVAGASRAIGAALGVGVITAGLALIVKYFDDIKQAAYNLIPGLKNITGFFTNIVEKVGDWLGVTSEAERANKRLLENTSKTAQEVERDLEVNGDKYDKYQRERLQAYAQYLAAYNEALKNDAKLSASQRNELLKGLGEKYNRELAKIDEQRTEDAKKEQEKRNADYRKSLEEKKKIDEEFAKEKQELNDSFAALEKKANAEVRKAEEDLRRAKMTDREREIEDLENTFAEKKSIVSMGGGDIVAIEKLYDVELRALKDKHNAEDVASNIAKNKELSNADKQAALDKIQLAKDVEAAKIASEAAVYEATKSAFTAMGSLFEQGSDIQKAFAFGSILADTAQAISAAVANAEKNPNNWYTFGGAGFAQFVASMARITANIGSAVALIRKPNPIKSAGGGVAQPNISNYNINSSTLSGVDFSGNQRVFVTEYDISSAQRRVERTKGVSVF